jgi:hypothetical protein
MRRCRGAACCANGGAIARPVTLKKLSIDNAKPSCYIMVTCFAGNDSTIRGKGEKQHVSRRYYQVVQ